MTIEELIDKLYSQSGNPYLGYRTFILNLIRSILEKKSTPIRIPPYGWLLTKDGIEEIQETTFIRTRSSIENLPTERFWERTYQGKKDFFDENHVKTFLIIPMRPYSNESFEKFVEVGKKYFTDLNIRIWDSNKINDILKKYDQEAKEIANQLVTLKLKDAIDEGIDSDWKSKRDQRISDLKEIYKNGTLSLLLGAGVSCSAGMPDWNTLLNSLFVSFLSNEFNSNNQLSESDIQQIVNRLNEINGQSGLILARYLKIALENNSQEAKNYANKITTNLYKLRDKNQDESSDLIKSIVNMCMPLRRGAKIKSVITYNFDNLLEKELNKSHIHNHSIYSDDVNLDPDKLPIYHVHGFLPEDRSNYKNIDKSTLVFSEDGYHKIYSDAYHWSNLIQLTNLKENSCLLIGLSMTDPNLRRLLEIAARNIDKPKHFVFMKRLSNEKFIYKDGKKIIDNDSGASLFLEKHHSLNELTMRELGLSVIWYTDYDEIPKILNEITAVH